MSTLSNQLIQEQIKNNKQIQYPQISIENCRWIVYPKNGNLIVENHQFGRTWKKVYQDTHQNIISVCFQLIPDGIKYFANPSPYGDYWVFEEFICQFGGTPQHLNRNLCSRIDENGWEVITVDAHKQVTTSIMTSQEIGYMQ